MVKWTIGISESKAKLFIQRRFSPTSCTAQIIPSTWWETSAWNMGSLSFESKRGNSFKRSAYPAAFAATVIPFSVRDGPIWFRPAVTTPKVWLRRRIKLRASALGRYPNFSMASCTRIRVSCETLRLSLMTRDTVCVETRAMAATSLMVGRTIFLRMLSFSLSITL